MLEVIFSILAACLTIFIAGLLVRRQNECHEKTLEIYNKNQQSMNDIIETVELLTKESEVECSLTYLEKRIDLLNKSLNIIITPKQRRIKNGKRKKNFTDD